MSEANPGVDFLARLFGNGITQEPVYVSSLANDDAPASEPREKRILTRDMEAIRRFVAKWDRPHRGLFFCVGTISADAVPSSPGGSPRNKDNIVEMSVLQADIDFKDVVLGPDPRSEALEALKRLPLPPTVKVSSGHGLHVYWPLNEALPNDPETREQVESVLRQLADLVGGDLKVAEIARLMRLPGSHNSKRGGWVEVEVIEGGYDRRYELSDIEEMVSWMSPVIRRREVEASGPAGVNPFLAIAARLGFKPSIDVERRLSAMSYQGVGETSIHETQLQVSASLLSRGTPVEEVVDILIEATRSAAGSHSGRWNWVREERAVRRMCEEWVRKHPLEPKVAPVIQLKAARQEREEAKAKAKAAPTGKADKVPVHIVLGTAVIEVMEGRGERLLVTAGQIWRYADGLWSTPMLDGKRWLDVEVERACRELRIQSTTKIVNEAKAWMLRHPDLYREEVPWDAHGKIPTKSGLVDPRTLAVEPPAVEHFSTWRIECDFDPTATCPWWERGLDDTFSDRAPELRSVLVGIIQEVFGTTLIEDKPRALTRAIIFQGGSETGKTQLLDIMSGLLSPRPISTPLEALDGTHGTMEFARRAPWVLHEAFDQGKWHFSSKVKQILSGDPTQINIKNGAVTTERVKAPVFWATNHPPQFREATTAIINRMIIFKCRVAFSRDAPIGMAAEARRQGFTEPRDLILSTEMPGLLNWAIAGLRRALDRGYLPTTAELDETLHEVRMDSNMAAGFVEECVEFNQNGMVSVPDFCAAFAVWWAENKGTDRSGPSNDSVGRAVAALGDARIGHDTKDFRDNARRYYGGVHLNPTGTDYWAGAANAGLAQGKTARISAARDDVNRLIPASWDSREAVARMRQAHDFLKKYTSGPGPVPRDTSVSDTQGEAFEECHEGVEVSRNAPLF